MARQQLWQRPLPTQLLISNVALSKLDEWVSEMLDKVLRIVFKPQETVRDYI